MSKPALNARFRVVTTPSGSTVIEFIPGADATEKPSGKPAAVKSTSSGKAQATKGGAGDSKPKQDSKQSKPAGEKVKEGGAGGGGAGSGTPTSEPKSYARRDRLRGIEVGIQQKWAEEKTFEEDAPASGVDDGRGKFFVTFPYPYMNGKLHLGHAFTITKADFSANFHRLLGEHVLFPFAFHCTGMPIQAAANKLKRELETADEPEEEKATATAPTPATNTTAAPTETALGQFRGRKTKLVSKSGSATQYAILLMSGVPEEDIPKFVVSFNDNFTCLIVVRAK